VGVEVPGSPVCTIIGGPNGSGKSTIYGRLAPPGRFLNADVIARGINPGRPEAAFISAGRQTLAELARVIGARETFVYETTLSSRQSAKLMLAAKQAGYEVGLVFVILNSADLNVERVAERVARGGHDIPEDVIRRRYETAIRRLPQAIGSKDKAPNTRTVRWHLLHYTALFRRADSRLHTVRSPAICTLFRRAD
jgi:predicted ABC-type ATPase